MTDRIKLSELVAARKCMTRCEYKAEDSWNNGGLPLADFSIPGSCTGATVEMLADDAHGIVATHAAADVLIEIAQAALALRDARNPDDPELRERYFIALDKVQP